MISFHINNTTSNDNVSHGLTSKVVEVKMHAVLHTVHGRNPANQLRLVVYPSIYKAFLHPRWFLGISEPSTVSLHFYTLTTFFYLHFTACTELPSMHFFPHVPKVALREVTPWIWWNLWSSFHGSFFLDLWIIQKERWRRYNGPSFRFEFL